MQDGTVVCLLSQVLTAVMWSKPDNHFSVPVWIIILAVLVGLLLLALLIYLLYKVMFIQLPHKKKKPVTRTTNNHLQAVLCCGSVFMAIVLLYHLATDKIIPAL